MGMQTVRSIDEKYLSPVIGNGEVVTTVGPTGYHNGADPITGTANRVIAWAGRRMNTPTYALIRFGTLQRALRIDQQLTEDISWAQTLDYDSGIVVSSLHHGDIDETTRSLVCLTQNVLIFRTTLENRGAVAVDIEFALDYHFPAVIEKHNYFQTAGQVHPAPEEIGMRVKPRDQGFSVEYYINHQLGEVRVESFPGCAMTTTENGGGFSHKLTLAPGQQTDLWLWMMLSDRRKFTHFPDFALLPAIIDDHTREWSKFWATSHVEFEDEQLTALRQSCLYGIRCSASPWSIPPTYLPAYWEGRTFHDELYPFLGLLSGGYTAMARRIPAFRLNTLPMALYYGGGDAAKFPWETIETGEEGGPYGPWMDERLHIGQFSESAWRYCQYSGDDDDLRVFYPLLRGCAEMYVHDVLLRDAQGVLKTRQITDFDESIYPVSNGVFTIAAAIRTLENAASAAQQLDTDTHRRAQWWEMAQELRQSVPGQTYYTTADESGTDHWHIAQIGPIYPFGIDVMSPKAHETLSQMHRALATERNVTAGSLPSYKGSHWMWAAAMIATGYFLQGRGDEGYCLLRQVINSTSPFLSPNEQSRDDGRYFIPWFTTSSGAIVFAMHSMFVQVDKGMTTLLNGVGSQLRNAKFERLLATRGVRVSGEICDGQLIRLVAHSPVALDWSFRLSAHHVPAFELAEHTCEANCMYVQCALNAGDTLILGSK